jgi:signal transduction histidine kinase
MKRLPRLHSIQGSLLLHELSFVFLILITATVAVVWGFAWQKSAEESLRLTAMNSHVQSIRGELYRQLKEVFDAAFLDDQHALDEYNFYSRRIHNGLADLRILAEQGNETAVISEIETAYSDYQQQTRELLRSGSLSEEQKNLLDYQLEQHTFARIESAFSRFDRLLKDKQSALAENRQRWMSQLMLLLPLPVLLAATLLLVSRRFVRNNLVRPLAAVMHGARLISKGNLNHQIASRGVDDLIKLAEAINTMADELASNRDKLVDARKQAAMGELVPLVAHNIRNPLSGIRAAAQVTLDEHSDPEIQDVLRDIIIAVDRLERWVTSLLTYLHPNKPHFTNETLQQVVDNVILLIQLQLADKNMQIEKSGWDIRASLLAIDTNLMEQTVFNLAQNAIEASPAGAKIQFIYRESETQAELCIHDQGSGMRFDPVAEQVTDGEAKRMGCGLGIPFALKVIKQHDGELIYDSEPGKPTRVYIRLPKQHDELQE